jgi:flagellar hook-basal body complex protein FliE
MSEIRFPEIGAGRYTPLGRPAAPSPTETEGFAESLKSALGDVNTLQNDAGNALQRLVAGENVDIHEVMISNAEAGIAFDLMMEIRNKLVEAYQELQRMQV